MIPPTSVAIAAVFLHEPITLALGLGAACILLGLVATQIASTVIGQRRE
jgi:drug/metabolite transporter (DMT)-like permease